MYEVQIKIPFRYGHRLLPPYEGKCNNVHGEGGTAIVVIAKEDLDNSAMVIDFKVAKQTIKDWVDTNWDHSFLHHKKDEVGKYLKKKGLRTYSFGVNPTAEVMAYTLYYELKPLFRGHIKKVGIVESFEDSIAWYEEVERFEESMERYKNKEDE
jgi:6-pyruvoyltetrahydropterin/6-carboxytetrahydropterin synthase